MANEAIGEVASEGGKARDAALTPKEKSEIGKKGADARWGKSLPAAIDEGVLNLNGKEIAAAVLEDERRVLTQETFLVSIGRAKKAKAGTGSKRLGSEVDELPPFLAADNLNEFIDHDLRKSTKPILYRTQSGGRAFGYLATLLPAVCRVYIAADNAGKLKKNQKHIAAACRILHESLADVAIIALVDEATGYQYKRSATALEQFLAKYMNDKFAKWVKRFSNDFYRDIYRLKGWTYNEETTARTPLLGKITNDLVYSRLAPFVLEEMKKRTPKDENGRRKHKFHQLLTEDLGIPELQDHFKTLHNIATGYDTGEWRMFIRHVGRALPLQPQNPKDFFPLFVEDDDQNDEGLIVSPSNAPPLPSSQSPSAS